MRKKNPTGYRTSHKKTHLLVMICCILLYLIPFSRAFGNEPLALTHELQEPFLGDLPAMKARHVIRALVTYS